MVTIENLLTSMLLDEYTHVVVVDADTHYYLGGGYLENVLHRFGDMRVCSTGIRESNFMIFVEQ